MGNRSKQAAAYPKELCRAICQGLVQSMKIDFVVAELDCRGG